MSATRTVGLPAVILQIGVRYADQVARSGAVAIDRCPLRGPGLRRFTPMLSTGVRYADQGLRVVYIGAIGSRGFGKKGVWRGWNIGGEDESLFQTSIVLRVWVALGKSAMRGHLFGCGN